MIKTQTSHFKRRVKESICRLLPRNDVGDAAIGLICHINSHRSLPNLRHPRTYNEYLLRTKLSQDLLNPLMGFITDKEFVKEFVRAKLGESFNIPTLAILRDEEAIDSYDFPKNCVIKPTSGSGDALIRKDALPEVDKTLIKDWLHKDFYLTSREKNYRNHQRKIIVEELLTDYDGGIPNDYKIYCFEGVPAFVRVISQRFDDGNSKNKAQARDVGRQSRQAIFSPTWNRLPLDTILPHLPSFDGFVPKPPQLSEMLELASILAKDFAHVRVDLYVAKGKIRVGELTFVPGNAKTPFVHSHADNVVGRLFTEPRLDLEKALSDQTGLSWSA